uniref:MH2 domain-containing protein n=1 Tax=Heterorhabditis bacteriophora TaxID=37862 RepID=A0A1I7X3Z7_HETBA
MSAFILNGVRRGKIHGYITNRCKRVAKAYLRKTTVIVDGSEEEFDGKTLGLNHFDNPERDEYTQDVKSKIGDVYIKNLLAY